MAGKLPKIESRVVALDSAFCRFISRSVGMEKIPKKQSSRGSVLPGKAPLTPPAEPVHSEDVERVLEHISSPFRWELLEVPLVQPKIVTPKKPVNLKSRSK
jgi:hypothetical protein